MAVAGRVHMPSLGGATGWLNSEPLGPAELRGHVVLVGFWTLTCINWLRTEPYDDQPVVPVNEYEVWTAFDNHYWPALYFIDAEGIVRDLHFGEGRYEQSERVIQRLLGVERGLVSVVGAGVEAEADWKHLRTPETYLGYGRRERSRHWALTGEWTSGPETVVLDRAGGSIAYRFHARDAHLVLSGGARAPIPFRVLLDGEAPGPSHGVDVDEDGNGVLRDGRLYQLVRAHDAVRERTLEITFLEPGAEAYVFTFG
jgi:Thioredoxin like C-terminal domain